MIERLTPQVIAFLVGAGFFAFGVMGFIPGIMFDFDQLELAGHESHAEWLGVGQLSILHNVIHLAIGVLGFAVAAKGARESIAYLLIGGTMYGIFGIYGFLVGPDTQANWAPTNAFDDTLHLVAAAAMLGFGLYFARRAQPQEPAPVSQSV